MEIAPIAACTPYNVPELAETYLATCTVTVVTFPEVSVEREQELQDQLRMNTNSAVGSRPPRMSGRVTVTKCLKGGKAVDHGCALQLSRHVLDEAADHPNAEWQSEHRIR